jgi:hypothetical protein
MTAAIFEIILQKLSNTFYVAYWPTLRKIKRTQRNIKKSIMPFALHPPKQDFTSTSCVRSSDFVSQQH